MIRGRKDLQEKMKRANMCLSAERGRLRKVDVTIQREQSSGRKREAVAQFKSL